MRLRYLGICVCGFLLLSTSAFAAKMAPASSPKKAEKGTEKIIAGHVVSINIDKKELSVERKGKQYSITVDASTQITTDNGSSALDKISVGDFISASYFKAGNGVRLASTIEYNALSKSSEKSVTKKEVKKEHVAAAPKAGAKAEVKKEPVTVAPKAEAKAEVKKEPVTAAPKAEAKAEVKKEPVTAAPKAEVKAEVKKEPVGVTPKAEVKKDSVAVPQKTN